MTRKTKTLASAAIPSKVACALPTPEPIAVTLREAERISGLSGRTLYRDLAAGRIRAVKRGTATLILMESLRGYIASLPPATFRDAMVTKAA